MSQAVAKALGLQSNDLSDSEVAKAKTIDEFVKGDVAELRKLEQKLGITALGERRIDQVYRYVRLHNQI